MSNEKQSIRIGIPYTEKNGEAARLCARIDIGNKRETMWFSVDSKYGQYLAADRTDAFVAGALTTALRSGMDIICEGFVTRRLLYQLNHYLIPMMAGTMKGYRPIKIRAEALDTVQECAEAVATGWTGGVDSMYTLMRALDTERKNYQLTHLMIANNGALEGTNTSDMLKVLVERTEKNVAAEFGLHVIGIDTNLQKLFSEEFLSVSSFRHASVILALQGLIGKFLCSSTYEFSGFSFDFRNASYYELASLAYFETDCTAFYSSYGAYSRVQKLKELSDFPLAQKILHPCIYALTPNCGRCDKCIRTETVLYGLGTLNKFSAVFDVEQFEKNKDWYFANVLTKRRNQHYGEALELIQRSGESLENAKRMERVMRAAQSVVNKSGISI